MDEGEITVIDSSCGVDNKKSTLTVVDQGEDFTEINDLIASVVSEAVNGDIHIEQDLEVRSSIYLCVSFRCTVK